ncbi:MAG: TetR family transcriptional regulator, partial [Pyrinomonadaceae bacterium]
MARHKEFDRDEALQRAMEVFWSRGYEAASVGELVKH